MKHQNKPIRVDDLLPRLNAKAITLRSARKKLQAEGKTLSSELQSELNLICNIIYKLERYGELQARVQKAEKIAVDLQQEKRQWLERLCLLSIDMRELAQEVRFAALAKSLPKKGVQNEA